VAALVVTVVLALVPCAFAHHGQFYDQCKRVTIEGRVERVELKNPHNSIVLRLDDGTAFTVDWINLTRLKSAGILDAAKEALTSGSRVTVTGYLIRDPAGVRQVAPKFKGTVDPNTVEARLMRRIDDSFNWGMPPPAFGPDCRQ